MVKYNPNNHFQAVNAKTHFGTPPTNRFNWFHVGSVCVGVLVSNTTKHIGSGSPMRFLNTNFLKVPFMS